MSVSVEAAESMNPSRKITVERFEQEGQLKARNEKQKTTMGVGILMNEKEVCFVYKDANQMIIHLRPRTERHVARIIKAQGNRRGQGRPVT